MPGGKPELDGAGVECTDGELDGSDVAAGHEDTRGSVTPDCSKRERTKTADQSERSNQNRGVEGLILENRERNQTYNNGPANAVTNFKHWKCIAVICEGDCPNHH